MLRNDIKHFLTRCQCRPPTRGRRASTGRPGPSEPHERVRDRAPRVPYPRPTPVKSTLVHPPASVGNLGRGRGPLLWKAPATQRLGPRRPLSDPRNHGRKRKLLLLRESRAVVHPVPALPSLDVQSSSVSPSNARPSDTSLLRRRGLIRPPRRAVASCRVSVCALLPRLRLCGRDTKRLLLTLPPSLSVA